MNVVRRSTAEAVTQRSRVLYGLAVGVGGGAAIVVSGEVFGVSGRWVLVPGVVTMFIVALALNVWMTGRPHFFSPPFKR